MGPFGSVSLLMIVGSAAMSRYTLTSAFTKMSTSASLALIQSRLANRASSLASTSNIGSTLNLSPAIFISLFLLDRSMMVASVWPAISAATRLDEPDT
jgi:hypothetical protein